MKKNGYKVPIKILSWRNTYFYKISTQLCICNIVWAILMPINVCGNAFCSYNTSRHFSCSFFVRFWKRRTLFQSQPWRRTPYMVLMPMQKGRRNIQQGDKQSLVWFPTMGCSGLETDRNWTQALNHISHAARRQCKVENPKTTGSFDQYEFAENVKAHLQYQK